jgi:perosamine synthetase
MLKKNNPMNEFPILSPQSGIPLFHPKISRQGFVEVNNTLKTRWIGQGPKVDLFEKKIKKLFLDNKLHALAVGSGTDALHLAYLLADIKKGDEVLAPVFTCTATNLPLLYIGAKPVFVDIDPTTMNLNIEDIEKKITKKTKAIVCVDYGGVPNNYLKLISICKKNKIKLISDAAHSLGTKYLNKYACMYSDFTIFSFQAIKTLTTGDGGLLIIKNKKLIEKAKRLRWFGIDRSKKQLGIWENDIKELGYKYQMNDIAASLGLAGLKEIKNIIKKRILLFKEYEKNLNHKYIKIIGQSETKDYKNSCWLFTIHVEKNRNELMKKLRRNGIESAQVHYRNDRYSVFGKQNGKFHNMDNLENKYLVLPLYPKMKLTDVKKISKIINSGW